MSDGFWMSFFTFITFLATQWITYRKAEQAEKAAKGAGADAVAASVVNKDAIAKVAKEVKEVKADIVVVKTNTDGLTTKLVNTTEKEALARGAEEERQRAESAKQIE